MPKAKFYIRERINPQLSKPYYTPLGQKSKKDIKQMSQPLYGYYNFLSFNTEKEYLECIESLKERGFRVS